MKSPDWIQELYLKELFNAKIKGEKTHDRDRPAAKKVKRITTRNRGIPKQL